MAQRRHHLQAQRDLAADPAWPRARVACPCPPLSRIQITGQDYRSSGPWLMWHIGLLACICRAVSPGQVCRPRIASLIPSSSGKREDRGGAAVVRRAVLVFLRWECASMLSHSSGRSRAGGAVMPWPLTLTRPVVSPWKVHRSSAATCVLAGTGRGISRTIVCK